MGASATDVMKLVTLLLASVLFLAVECALLRPLGLSVARPDVAVSINAVTRVDLKLEVGALTERAAEKEGRRRPDHFCRWDLAW